MPHGRRWWKSRRLRRKSWRRSWPSGTGLPTEREVYLGGSWKRGEVENGSTFSRLTPALSTNRRSAKKAHHYWHSAASAPPHPALSPGEREPHSAGLRLNWPRAGFRDSQQELFRGILSPLRGEGDAVCAVGSLDIGPALMPSRA